MPYKKDAFVITEDNLAEAVDVDDSAGRSVPINMNFVDVGYLSKDTGTSLHGAVEASDDCHSIFNYEKKDGTSYFVRVKGTALQKYNTTTSLWENISGSPTFTSGAKMGYVTYNDILYMGNATESVYMFDGTTFTAVSNAPKGNIFEVFEDRMFISGVTSGTGLVGTCTMTIASPCVVTKTAHGLVANDQILFVTDGTLPTGVTAGTTYYVLATDLTANTFKFSTSSGGAAVNTSGTQSGSHALYIKNRAQPLSVYYSNIGDPLVWNTEDILQPLGTDSVTNLKNYYGSLLIFKQDSIWKLTFVFDSVVSLYLPKLELQSGNYGACSRNAVTWVENDLWFFTGREVRSIGFKDQQQGVLGVNSAVISNQIKETLYTIDTDNFSKISVAYNNRRFYLSVPIDQDYNDTVFVCHILYKNTWTKYTSRIKANTGEMISIDNVVYSTKSVTPYGVLKWDEALLNDNGVAIPSEVFFKKVEDKDFNTFNTYRYLDIMFKNLTGKITVAIKQDANDLTTAKTKIFYIGQAVEDEEGALGEITTGQYLVGDSFGETVLSSPFAKNRLSFLSKAQSLRIGISNNTLNETFTVAAYSLMGMKQPRRMFKPGGIVSIA